jgi:hypothetical protein
LFVDGAATGQRAVMFARRVRDPERSWLTSGQILTSKAERRAAGELQSDLPSPRPTVAFDCRPARPHSHRCARRSASRPVGNSLCLLMRARNAPAVVRHVSLSLRPRGPLSTSGPLRTTLLMSCQPDMATPKTSKTRIPRRGETTSHGGSRLLSSTPTALHLPPSQTSLLATTRLRRAAPIRCTTVRLVTCTRPASALA